MRKIFNRTIILLFLGILLVNLSVIVCNLPLNNVNLSKRAYRVDFSFDGLHINSPEISGRIHIDNNWSAVKAVGLCSGNGTFNEPYLIENLVINGSGNGSCILIENSNVYFKIANCTIFKAVGPFWFHAGISLNNVSNARITENKCSLNVKGRFLKFSDNNTITNNKICNNYEKEIGIGDSNYNLISEDIVNNKIEIGIWVIKGFNNTISRNTVNNNTHIGIVLDQSANNSISRNAVSNNTNFGISLYLSDDNKVSRNTVNDNDYGIYLYHSKFNLISENTMLRNAVCIDEENCVGNIFINNSICNYGQENAISGFNLLSLLIIMGIILLLSYKTTKKS
ncbi:MAG: nitrous oxide reductase family maturation protein NosD [Promethearchaeota archaeon]